MDWLEPPRVRLLRSCRAAAVQARPSRGACAEQAVARRPCTCACAHAASTGRAAAERRVRRRAAPTPATARRLANKGLGLGPTLPYSHRYGDSLRSGWRNVLDAVIRLHGLGLLPPGVVLLEAGDPDGGKLALPRAPASRRTASASSILSRAFSRRAPAYDGDALGRSWLRIDPHSAAFDALCAKCTFLIADCKAHAIALVSRQAGHGPGR